MVSLVARMSEATSGNERYVSPGFRFAHPGYARYVRNRLYRPVFTRVHNRLMTRWVAGSRAVMTNSFASIAWCG